MTLEADYTLVRAALIEYENNEGWDLTDEKHALARIWHAMRKAGLVSYAVAAEAGRPVAQPDGDDGDVVTHG